MNQLLTTVQGWLYVACFIGVGWFIVKMVWKGSIQSGIKQLGGCLLLLFFLKYPDFIDAILLAFRGVIVGLLGDMGGLEFHDISNPGTITPTPDSSSPGAELL